VASTTLTGGVEDSGRVAWDEIRRQWREREYDALRFELRDFDARTIRAVDELLFGTGTTTQAKSEHVLRDAFEAAAEVPHGGRLLLALYVHGRCLDKWEQSEDYERIRNVLGGLDAVAGGSAPPGAPTEEELVALVVRQATAIDGAMSVEDALSCSCPVALEGRSRRLVADLLAVLDREQALGDGLDEPREVVRADALTSLKYFGAIADVALAVGEWVDQDGPGPAGYFDDVLQTLDGALDGDVYESELRAHRAALLALQESAQRPHLRVDAAEVVYVYPFALRWRGADSPRHDDAVARTLADDAVVRALAQEGITPAVAHELDINDVWERVDVVEAGYAGAAIDLPPVSVLTTGDDVPLEFTAEARLSRLGNHYLRVRSRLENAGLHEVNQALRRGSHAMGEEQVSSGTAQWATVTEYAEEVIGAIAVALGAERVLNPNARFHVVLAARLVSARLPDGTTVPATPELLRESVGASLLFHPVRHLTTSLEEWIRYPAPEVENVLGRQGYTGDLVARTDNTTVTFMQSSPEWLIDEYEEMIEFVASIPPLLTLWERKALDLADELEEGGSIEKLHDDARKILELEQDIRAQLAFLRSPALCRTLGHRQFLDALWTAAGLPELEAELERRLTMLADRQARIATRLSSMDERNRERRGIRVEIVLGVLAAASIAGVLQWVDATYTIRWAAWRWCELAALVVVAAGALAIIWRSRRSA
jgi:hypothetical protein